ncbi:hypothetical protein [Paenibacillus sp. FSL H3-0286]|uniref:hypothetical protein n=1 Tax=Paenibacillus sp. FSL H3-0286 TaxID=2921427 RepID=UPI00324DB867
MTIENLHVGLVAKSYRHMCKILDESIKEGGAKEAQVKRWACYFEHEKQGNKWIVTKIYEVPKPLPQRGGDRNVITYIDTIKKLLMELLLNANTESVNFGKNRLLNVLNMVNSNYRKCSRYVPSLSQYTGIEQFDIHDFYNSANSTLKGNLEKALNQLKASKNIYYSQLLMVSKDNKVRPADDNEYKIILKAQGEILDQMGLEHRGVAVIRGQYDKYTQLVNNLLIDRAGIKYTYEAYDIKLNRERLEREYIKMKKEERLACESELNKSIQDRITVNINNRHTKAINKDDNWFEVMNFREGRRITPDYVENQMRLLDILIDSHYEHIYEDVKKIKWVNKGNLKS